MTTGVRPILYSTCALAGKIARAMTPAQAGGRRMLSLLLLGVLMGTPSLVSSFMTPGVSAVRSRGLIFASSRPPSKGAAGGGDEGGSSDRRRRRFSSGMGQPKKDEGKKEEKFSKDHFYTGKLGISTYAWGDPRWGFFYGEYPTGAHDRSQLLTGAFNEQDIEEVFLFLEEQGFPLFNSRELAPCEAFLGDMAYRWKKRQAQQPGAVKQVRPFIATTYEARLLGRGLTDIRGGRRALMKALEKSLENLQSTRIDLYQVTRPSKLYWGGEKAVFEALGNAKRMRLVDHVGLIGYKADQLEPAKTLAKGYGLDLKSNAIELSLANPWALEDGTIDMAKNLGLVTFATRPLAGGLSAGTYTMMDPTGGRSRRPRYSFQDLEPLYPVHKALKETATKVAEKLKKRVSTAQVALNWVRAHGAIPLVGVKNEEQAKDSVEATKWDLEPEDVAKLDDVALDVFRKRKGKLSMGR